MRGIVGALRTASGAELTPQAGLGDVVALTTSGPARPRIEVTLDGRLDDLSPAVGAAIYRLAQESVTNARRHARRATQVTITVSGASEQVRLTVEDDGTPATGPGAAGYGLVGMRERASLLGGTFHAGPAASGWRVEAVLPRTGTTR